MADFHHNHADYDPYSYSKLHSLDVRADSVPDFAAGASSNTQILITKTAIAWIVGVSILATASLAIAAWLICGCCQSRRAKSESTRPLDDRNEFYPWNPAAPLVHEDGVEGEGEGVELRPLNKKERRAKQQGDVDEFLRPPGEPKVVDQAEGAGMRRKSRYYSRGGDGVWRRYSQRLSWIGKAH